MKKLLFLLPLLLSTIRTAYAVPVYQNLIFVTTAPSGACPAGNLSPDEQVLSTGVIYGCVGGTWTSLTSGGSGGGFPSYRFYTLSPQAQTTTVTDNTTGNAATATALAATPAPPVPEGRVWPHS